MKTLQKLGRLFILGVGLITVGLTSAQAQVYPTSIQTALTNLLTCTNNVFIPAATNATYITLQQGKGFGVQARAVGSSLVTTGMIGFGFAVSADGTNWPGTNNLLWAHLTPTGATEAWGFTNFPPSVVDNARLARLLLVTNNNAATSMVIWITNVMIHIKN